GGNPEIRKEQNHQGVQDIVNHMTAIQITPELFKNLDVIKLTEFKEDHGRKHQNRLSKNDGHDSGVIHAQGHERAAARIDLSSDRPLGVLHWNFSLRLRHGNDARYYGAEQEQKRNRMEDVESPFHSFRREKHDIE